MHRNKSKEILEFFLKGRKVKIQSDRACSCKKSSSQRQWTSFRNLVTDDEKLNQWKSSWRDLKTLWET